MSSVLQTNFERIKKNIPQYPLSTYKMNQILTQNRQNTCQNDCVVNALEIMDILNPKTAAKIREVIKLNNLPGLQDDQFIKILNTSNPLYNHKLEHIHMEGDDGLINWIETEMLPGTMIFTAYQSHNDLGHVYLIAKDTRVGSAGKNFLWLIDPLQDQPVCNLSIYECSSKIMGQKHYYVLIREEDDVEMKQENEVEIKQGMKQGMKNPLNMLKSKMYKKYSMRC
jgi:hypothetical protein